MIIINFTKMLLIQLATFLIKRYQFFKKIKYKVCKLIIQIAVLTNFNKIYKRLMK